MSEKNKLSAGNTKVELIAKINGPSHITNDAVSTSYARL